MKQPRKILFLVAHRPGRSPGQRFRFEQYIDYLSQNGYYCQISYLIDEKDDKIFYAEGKFLHKSLFLIKSLWKRWADISKAKGYDIIFLYREAHFLGTTFFERRLKKLNKKLVVDFDDSIWLKDVSNGNRNLAFLKKPSKTAAIVSMCDAVIVGNRYLADYAMRYNPNTSIIPTTLDTEKYTSNSTESESTSVCIGWTGSSTTIKHFSLAVPILIRLKEIFKERVHFRLISDTPFSGQLEGLTFVPWSRETEVIDLQALDIGIMPLPDDEWAKGKCGFKGLQYMALGKPAVLSPVGVNTEIINHGENGFLANTEQDWISILSQLIEDADLRKRIGINARKTVEKRFSFHSQKENYLAIFNHLLLPW